MSTSPSRSDRLNRIIGPLEELLAGRGSRMAEPGRMLMVALLFLFLVFKLRRLAGMAANGGIVRPRARRAAAVKPLEKVASLMPQAEPTAEPSPAIPGPDILPPPEPVWPDPDRQPKMPPYGDYLLRLIQQMEIRALLEAAPQLKAKLRRLLALLGSEIPPELAPTPRPPRPTPLKRPNRPARAWMARTRRTRECAPKPIVRSEWRLAPWPPDRLPSALKRRMRSLENARPFCYDLTTYTDYAAARRGESAFMA